MRKISALERDNIVCSEGILDSRTRIAQYRETHGKRGRYWVGFNEGWLRKRVELQLGIAPRAQEQQSKAVGSMRHGDRLHM